MMYYYLTERSLKELKSLIENGELSPSGHKTLVEVDKIFHIMFGKSTTQWLCSIDKSTDEKQDSLVEEETLKQEHTTLKNLTVRNGPLNTEISLYPFFSIFYGGLCGFRMDYRVTIASIVAYTRRSGAQFTADCTVLKWYVCW